MSRGKTAKTKLISAAVGIIMVFALLVTLSERGVIPLNIPSWNDIFSGAELQTASADTDAPFTVHYLDVGQGDSIFVKSPDGCVLIDGGNDGDGAKIARYIKALGVQSLDYVIATHPHEDHIGGLDEVIEDFEVKNVIMPRLTKINTPATQCYENFLKAVRGSGAKVIAAKQGTGYEIGKAYMLILSPFEQSEELNDMSVVARISYGETYFLFMGDASTLIEKALLKSDYSDYLKADVLKAGHHGSRYSSSTSFLNKVWPDCIVISCGAGNSYGHPHSDALKRMNKTDAKILRTDLDGTVVVGSDGETLSYSESKE